MTPFGKSIVGVLIVGVLGTSFYFVNRKNAIPTSPDTPLVTEVVVVPVSTSTSGTTTLPTGKKMAFGEFMKQDKGPYVCTLNQDIDGISTKGTLYVSGGKLQGVFVKSVSGSNQTFYMLVKEGYSYAWDTYATSTGVKIKTLGDDGSIPIGGAATKASASWNPDNVGDYTCEATPISDSKFMLPRNVTFTEI